MGTFKNVDWTLRWRSMGMRFGVEKHRIFGPGATPYQDRYMLCLGLIELRLHRFWRGDDDRAPHDHPWWFITFPFVDYVERIAIPGIEQFGAGHEDQGRFDFWVYRFNVVRAWRFHFRPAEYKHVVIGKLITRGVNLGKPFWTFVITGRKTRGWGFWRRPSTFTDHKDWV